MFEKDPQTPVEKRERFLAGLAKVKFSQNHSRIYSRVLVKKPRFLPRWLYSWVDKNYGKEGIVTFVEICECSKVPMYTVLFENGDDYEYGHYFDRHLDFQSPKMLTEREKKMLRLDKFG